MSPVLVALCYGSATLVALLLLWHSGVRHWYWHLLSIVAAFVLGLTPLPERFNTPQMTLAVGWVFVFLFFWGAAAPVFALVKHPPDLHFRRH